MVIPLGRSWSANCPCQPPFASGDPSNRIPLLPSGHAESTRPGISTNPHLIIFLPSDHAESPRPGILTNPHSNLLNFLLLGHTESFWYFWPTLTSRWWFFSLVLCRIQIPGILTSPQSYLVALLPPSYSIQNCKDPVWYRMYKAKEIGFPAKKFHVF